jgi:hypothetical protein
MSPGPVRLPSVAGWLPPVTVAAVLSFGAAVACAFLVRDVAGAVVEPCEPASPSGRLVLNVPELSRSPDNPRFSPAGCVLVSGYFAASSPGAVEMRVIADGVAALSVDGVVIAETRGDSGARMARGPMVLTVGWHRFEMRFEPTGQAQLRAALSDGTGARPLGPTFVRAPSAIEAAAASGASLFTGLTAVLLIPVFGGLLASGRLGAGLVAVVSLAAVFRFEALVSMYGASRPGSLTLTILRLGRALRPEAWGWEKVLEPYVGGDPVNYIVFARSMVGFFDAHVREPLFVAWSRLFIVHLGFGDFGISIASALPSCALVGATLLFARSRFGGWAAGVASTLLAIDPAVIALSPEGWRDGIFALGFILSLWSFEKTMEAPTPGNALLTGGLLGAACLVRLSALSYALPAVAGLAFFAGDHRRRGFQLALVCGLAALALLGPYLLACAIAFGDPLYAINYHLRFYEPGSQAAASGAVSTYLLNLADPWTRMDTAFAGLTEYPFAGKWAAAGLWFGPFASVLAALSAFGLFGLLGRADGRRILALTILALVPFAFTWEAPGGSEFRFTLFAFPVLLTAAGWTTTRVWAALRGEVAPRRVAVRTAATLVTVCVFAAVSVGLRHERVTRDGYRGREFTVTAGPRDALSASGFGLFSHEDGRYVRRSPSPSRSLSVVLNPDFAWTLTLRVAEPRALELREGGRGIIGEPAKVTGGPPEYTFRLPASAMEGRTFAVSGDGEIAFVSARFSPGPPRL